MERAAGVDASRADVAFRTVLEEQDRANRRLLELGGDSLLATAAFAVFESPMWLRRQAECGDRPYASATADESTRVIDKAMFFPMLARVCANLRDLQIVDELNRRELSPKQLNGPMDDLTLPGV